MALAKQWQSLDRSTVGRAPERYGYYELGDNDGDIVDRGWGVLKDELKEALSYGTGTQVRWTVAEHREHAKSLYAEHEP